MLAENLAGFIGYVTAHTGNVIVNRSGMTVSTKMERF